MDTYKLSLLNAALLLEDEAYVRNPLSRRMISKKGSLFKKMKREVEGENAALLANVQGLSYDMFEEVAMSFECPKKLFAFLLMVIDKKEKEKITPIMKAWKAKNYEQYLKRQELESERRKLESEKEKEREKAIQREFTRKQNIELYMQRVDRIDSYLDGVEEMRKRKNTPPAIDYSRYMIKKRPASCQPDCKCNACIVYNVNLRAKRMGFMDIHI